MKLNKWTGGDNLHIDSDIQKIDGYNKKDNFIVSEREPGKTTLMWKMIYNAYVNQNRPSIILKRYLTDISESYLEDSETLISEFTNQKIKFNYKKADLKSGLLTIRLNESEDVFCRIVGLNTNVSRLKSYKLPNVKYFMYDEFICNKRLGEKYLSDEPFRVKELYNTYNRENIKNGLPSIKCYYFGNPYSLYNPFFSDKNVKTEKLYPGALISDNDYVIWCYQMKPELKEKILKLNPLYQFDDAYKKYAFDGVAVQDANINIIPAQPEKFKLEYIFKLHNKYIGIYYGYRSEPDILMYWCKLLNPEEISKRRDIVCFDFGEMANKTVLMNNKTLYYSFKEAIQYRYIGFATIEESWLVEEIYAEI